VQLQRRIVFVGIVMELLYLSFYCVAGGPDEVLLFILVNAATFLLLSLLVWWMRRMPPAREREGQTVMLVAAMGLLFRLTLVPHDVVGSDDIYRYLWDGKVAASGINPYQFRPTDPQLGHLATADLPSKVNHPEMRSVYPAMAQAFFFFSYKLFGASAAGLKFLLVAIDCCTMLLLWMVLRRGGGSTLPIVLYAWSPLPILYFGLDGHIDALGIPFLLLSLFLIVTRRPVRGSLALGLGALAKLVPLIVVPFFFRAEKGMRRFVVPLIPLLMVAAGYLVYRDPTWGVLESLRTFGSQWEFNGGVFFAGALLTGSNETAHLISALEIALWVGVIAVLDRPFIEKVFWGVAGFILLSPVVHPWYLTWLGALLVLRWSTSMFVFLGLSFIANIVVYQYRAYGEWNDQPLLLLCEYVPVFVLMMRELLRGEVLRRGIDGLERIKER
jgi:alpha-1,6-mannosyltransferase